VFGAFPDALEVGFNLTLELEAVAPRTALERFLHDVAAQLVGGRTPWLAWDNAKA